MSSFHGMEAGLYSQTPLYVTLYNDLKTMVTDW